MRASIEQGAEGAELLVSIPEAARRLSVGRTTAYAMISAGRLRTVTVGRRRLVPVAALAEFVAELTDEQAR